MEEKPDQLEVRTGLGSLKTSGNMVTLVLVILAGFFTLGYMIWGVGVLVKEERQQASDQLMAVTSDRSKELRIIEVQQQALITQQQNFQDAMLYVTQLSAEDKSKLKLNMPASLRIKLLSQESASK